jgi:hypothetical protein
MQPIPEDGSSIFLQAISNLRSLNKIQFDKSIKDLLIKHFSIIENIDTKIFKAYQAASYGGPVYIHLRIIAEEDSRPFDLFRTAILHLADC